jgi:hypothetical protein
VFSCVVNHHSKNTNRPRQILIIFTSAGRVRTKSKNSVAHSMLNLFSLRPDQKLIVWRTLYMRKNFNVFKTAVRLADREHMYSSRDFPRIFYPTIFAISIILFTNINYLHPTRLFSLFLLDQFSIELCTDGSIPRLHPHSNISV